MRIGIITLPLHHNYGGILQAYALQTVLERMGHEVYLIEKKYKIRHLPLIKAPFIYGKRILKNLVGQRTPIFYERKIYLERPITHQYTNKFQETYIKKRIVEKYTDIREGDFDTIIVGSDQIWRPIYFPNIEQAFLKFTKGWKIQRIAYAASFGTDNWEYTTKQTRECGNLLKMFNAVSVRENTGVSLCHKYFNVEAKHVLDPTMLLSKEDYCQLFKIAQTPKSSGTLLNYILDETPEKNALIQKVANKKKLIPFRVNSPKRNFKDSITKNIHPPVEQWLRGFYDAEFVVTDSFHACVFSILFKKPFIVYGNKERGMSRFHSLLNLFGLEDRLVTTSQSNLDLKEINWNIIYKTFDKWKKVSIMFLLQALDDSKNID